MNENLTCKNCGTRIATEIVAQRPVCPCCGNTTFVDERAPDDWLCDLCNDPNPVWDYPVREHEVGQTAKLAYISTEGWLACDPCHLFIERGDWKGLLLRAATSFAAQEGTAVTMELLEATAQAHKGFIANRIGPPTRIREDAGNG